MLTRAVFSLSSFALVLLVASVASAAVYPTDRCVSDKLKSLGQQCRDALGALADFERHGDPVRRDLALAKAQNKLENAWLRADKKALGKGADCADSAHPAAFAAETIEDAAATLAELVNAGLDLGDADEAKCGEQLLDDAKKACRDVLRVEAKHLKQRPKDRLREKRDAALEKAETKSDARHQKTTTGVCLGLPAPDLDEALADGISEAMLDATSTRAVRRNEWTRIDPAKQVEYGGRTWEPLCSRGTDYAFYARRGTVNKLVMYYMGGGACWNNLTCNVVGTFADDVQDPSGNGSGFADQENELNPFKDWHAVFVPYCTGDVHWGDADYDHSPIQDGSGLIHHRGVHNARVAEKWAREHFVHPDQVFVTGSSAGSYGAIMHSLTLQELAYPSAAFSVLGDAGNGVITDDFLENEIGKWNVEENLPEWIPGLNVEIGDLSASDMWVESALFYPQNRFATYTTAYDGGGGGQTGFYNIMLNSGNAAGAITWWDASCAWNEEMGLLNLDVASRAPNYRYYVGTGSRHTMWGSDKVYNDTTGSVPTVVSWIDAMLGGTPDWVNVECEDCGTTLWPDPNDPGTRDPVPDVLPTAPFDADGNIVCP